MLLNGHKSIPIFFLLNISSVLNANIIELISETRTSAATSTLGEKECLSSSGMFERFSDFASVTVDAFPLADASQTSWFQLEQAKFQASLAAGVSVDIEYGTDGQANSNYEFRFRVSERIGFSLKGETRTLDGIATLNFEGIYASSQTNEIVDNTPIREPFDIQGHLEPGNYLITASVNANTENAQMVAQSDSIFTLTFHPDNFRQWLDLGELDQNSSPTSDTDQNGAALLLEYALGRRPGETLTRALLPKLELGDQQKTASLSFTSPRADIIYQAEWSSDGFDWKTENLITTTEDGITTATHPTPPAGVFLMRLKVNQTQ